MMKFYFLLEWDFSFLVIENWDLDVMEKRIIKLSLDREKPHDVYDLVEVLWEINV